MRVDERGIDLIDGDAGMAGRCAPVRDGGIPASAEYLRDQRLRWGGVRYRWLGSRRLRWCANSLFRPAVHGIILALMRCDHQPELRDKGAGLRGLAIELAPPCRRIEPRARRAELGIV